MKIIFKPTFDCIINVNNITIDPAQNNASVTADENANILVYPLASNNGEKLLPYAFRVSSLLNSGEAPSYIKLVMIEDEAEITLLPYPLFTAKCGYVLNEEKLFNQGKTYNLKINSTGEDNILLYQDKSLLLKYTVPSIEEAYISQIDNFAVVSGKTSKAFVLLINLKTTEVVLFKECEKIEIDYSDKKIFCLDDLKSSLRHGYVTIYKLSENFEVENEYPTLLEQVEKSNINAIKVFNFFDSIKAKDFLTAKSFLSPELANLSTDTLSAYFDEYNEIRQGSEDFIYYLIPNKNVCKADKLSFEFSDNLISNIKPV